MTDPRAGTLAEARETPLYRLEEPVELVAAVLTPLCHGCPIQAIVAAFGLNERTFAAWRDRAGRHGWRFHEHRALRGHADPGHVQADDLYVKTDGGRLWMAVAMAVPSRLWPGRGDRPEQRSDADHAPGPDGPLGGLSPAILACVDGLDG